MIYLICRALFMLLVLQTMHTVHANHIRHHHNPQSYHHHAHKSHSHSHNHNHPHRNHVDLDSYNVDDYVRSDNDYGDDDYYDYMSDLENREEEVAVGEFRSRSNSDTAGDTNDFYDYGDNDKETAYKPPDEEIPWYENNKFSDYQGDEPPGQKHIREQQEVVRYPRKVDDKMSLGTIQGIRRDMMRRSNSKNYDYQSDDSSRDPRRINEDKSRLGTRNGVQQEMNERRRNSAVNTEINRYINFIRDEWSCGKPRAKLIPVTSSDPSSRLLPHCVVLHMCGSDTGCCNSTHSCLPVKTELVSIPFYEILGDKPNITHQEFLNHTECGCLAAPCRCPTYFVAVLRSQTECTCQCRRQDSKCIQHRNGTLFFSENDKSRIQDGIYNVPKCTYGEYNKDKGKCPSQD